MAQQPGRVFRGSYRRAWEDKSSKLHTFCAGDEAGKMCDASLRDATAAYDAAFPVTPGFEVSLFMFVSAACCFAFRQPRSQQRAEERPPQRLT